MRETVMMTMKTGSALLAQVRAIHVGRQWVDFLGSDWRVLRIGVDDVAPTLTLVWLEKVTS